MPLSLHSNTLITKIGKDILAFIGSVQLCIYAKEHLPEMEQLIGERQNKDSFAILFRTYATDFPEAFRKTFNDIYQKARKTEDASKKP